MKRKNGFKKRTWRKKQESPAKWQDFDDPRGPEMAGRMALEALEPRIMLSRPPATGSRRDRHEQPAT